MIKILLKHVKQYKAASIATPFFMILEVAMEMTVPYLMASLVDDGIEKSDMRHILIVGGIMFIAALVGPFCRTYGWQIRSQSFRGICQKSERRYV